MATIDSNPSGNPYPNDNTHECLDCKLDVFLNQAGRCFQCGSDAVIPLAAFASVLSGPRLDLALRLSNQHEQVRQITSDSDKRDVIIAPESAPLPIEWESDFERGRR